MKHKHQPQLPSKPKLDEQQMALLDIFRIMRPHKSKEENEFVEDYIKKPLMQLSVPWFQDTFGNVHVHIKYITAKEEPEPRYVLFSCHTDTVHARGGKQVVMVDSNNIAYIDARGTKGRFAAGHCLGADDGTGCWIMMNMIRRRVPGYYIFHRAEECGGQGSAWIRDRFSQIIKPDIKIAIAFDRKGKTDLITHQSGTRGASDQCAAQIISQLKMHDIQMMPSTGGSFTDTANYFLHVDECFNMSVGYEKQHGPNETQDMDFAKKLLNALIKMDWRALSTFRDKTAVTPSAMINGHIRSWRKDLMHDLDLHNNEIPELDDVPVDMGVCVEELVSEHSLPMSKSELIKFVTEYPEAIAEWLADMSFGEEDALEALSKGSSAARRAISIHTRVLDRAFLENAN